MSLKKLTAMSAAIALATVPTMASAAQNPASSLSVASNARVASATSHKSDLAGMSGNGKIIAIVLALGVVAGGIIAITKDDKSASN